VVPANQYFVLKSIDTGAISAATPVTIAVSHFGNTSYLEQVMAQPYSQVSFSSGIVAAPGAEIYPFPVTAVTGSITLHGYLTSN
jgi:hypothetical protein